MQTKRIVLFQMIIVLMLLLTGCHAKDGNVSTAKTENKDSSEDSLQYQFLEELDLTWKDNSLDELQAVFHIPVGEVKQEGENVFQTQYDIKEDKIVAFRNHLLTNYKESWSGVSGITDSRETFSKVITVDTERVGRQLDRIGPIAGGSGYVAYKYDLDDSGICGHWFYVLDENFEKVSEFYSPELLDRNGLAAIAVDGNGNLHVITSVGKSSYVIFSPDGEKIFETTIEYHLFSDHQLYAKDDGRVIVCCEDCNEWKFLEADIEKRTMNQLVELDFKTIQKIQTIRTMNHYTCMKSEKELLYCNDEGVYAYDVEKQKFNLVYKWANHGIVPQELKCVVAKEDGTVKVIYQDTEGIHYLLLKPKFEDTEMKTVIFAVTPEHKSIYTGAAAAFNKKYPTVNIVLKDDYEETPLLTQLGSGEGPVIIDTEITGFDALEKLWQPLDGYLEKSGLLQDLYPQALEFGQIGDTTYGIVTNFAIESLLVKDSDLLGWDYDGFLNAVEKCDGSVFSYEFIFNPTDYRGYFLEYLSNGLEDNIYLNQKEGTVIFGTPEFKRLLTLAEKANPALPSDDGKILLEGKSLCEMLYISNVEQLVELRIRLESGEVYASGCPTKNGGKHLLEADAPIAIRSTATDEEKQIAYTFFKLLLSHDSAMSLTDNISIYTEHFSVRKDILQEQFKTYEQVYEINRGPAIDKEKDGILFEELLENSVVKKSFPADLQRVFDEEIGEYLDGEIPGELLDSRLKSRVGLYLDEN